MNMNMNPQQLNMGMNMAAMMQGRPPSVTGNLNSPSILSPSPTTPTQVRIDYVFHFVPELVKCLLLNQQSLINPQSIVDNIDFHGSGGPII